MKVSCTRPDCTQGTSGSAWQSEDTEGAVALELLKLHREDAHPRPEGQAAAAVPVGASRLAKLVKPSLALKDGQIEEEGWEYFIHRFASYKQQAGPEEAANCKQHLAECLGEEVSRAVFSRLGQTRWEALTEPQLLEEAKLICVRARNRAVNRFKLSEMKQGPEQSFRMFLAQVEPVARTCKFSQKCKEVSCGALVDFTEQMVLDTVVRGLHDNEVKRKVLARPESKFSLVEVEKFVNAEEVGQESLKQVEASTGNLTQLSTYRKQQAAQGKGAGANHQAPTKRAEECYKCGSNAHKWGDLSEEERKAQCPAHGATCQICRKTGHLAPVCMQGKQKRSKPGGAHNELGAGLLALHSRREWEEQGRTERDHQVGRGRGRDPKSNNKILGHLKFDKAAGRYVPASPGDTKRVKVEVEVDQVQFHKLGGVSPGLKIKVMRQEAVGDTGASLCCADPALLPRLGVEESSLMPTSVPLYSADKRRLRVRGCLPV